MSDLIKDPLDFASQLSEAERDNGVRNIQAKVYAKQWKDQHGNWGQPDCEECGEDIGIGRLEATGAVICVVCANRKEQRAKHYGK